MEAKFVRNVSPQFTGVAHVYHLSPPLSGRTYVVSSAVDNQYTKETMVFASDSDGKVSDWTDLASSHLVDPKAPLEALGYVVTP